MIIATLLVATQGTANCVCSYLAECQNLDSSCTNINFEESSLETTLQSACTNWVSFTAPYLVGDTLKSHLFEGCTHLQSATFDAFKGDIGYRAFFGCTNLTSVGFSEMEGSINDQAFYNTTLTSALFPKMTGSIGASAFENVTTLALANFEKMTGSIGNKAFKNTGLQTSANFNDMAGNIGVEAFSHTSLANANFPKMVGNIGDRAFEFSNIQEALFPLVTDDIGVEAFRYCHSFTKADFPGMTKSIKDSAFKHCLILTNASFPKMTGGIGDNAFQECELLNTVDFGQSSELGVNVFSGATVLKKLCMRHLKEADQNALEGSHFTSIHMPHISPPLFNTIISDVCYPGGATTSVCTNNEKDACGNVLQRTIDDDDTGLIVGLSVGGAAIVVAGLIIWRFSGKPA